MDEHPVLANNIVKFEYAVNYRTSTAPLFPRTQSVEYHHYLGTPKIMYQSQHIAQNSLMGVTAFYKDVDVELRGAVLHDSSDITKDM